jgi:hypothetical protein
LAEDGPLGHTQKHRDLFHAQATKEPEFHDASLVRIELRQRCQCVVQLDDIHSSVKQREGSLVKHPQVRGSFPAARPRACASINRRITVAVKAKN